MKTHRTGGIRTGQLIKEALVASLLVIAVDLVISFFPLKFEMIRPIKQGFNDFDIYDLRYSGNDSSITRMDTTITIVGIGADRRDIAEQINTIAAFHPAIIGLDAVFAGRRDGAGDSALIQAIRHAGKIVVASGYGGKNMAGKDSVQRSYFSDAIPGMKDGLWDFMEGPEEVNRHFVPFFMVQGRPYPALATAMLAEFAPGAYQTLLKRKKDAETINYSGNARHYNVVTWDRFSEYRSKADLFRGKIVLIGFINDRQPYLMEDLHFTPMNAKFAGKSFPDMYGIVIHANILEMALRGERGDYITDMPGWVSYVVTFCLAFGINLFYIRLQSRTGGHHHFLLFLLQFVLAVALIYMALLIFSWFNYRVDIMPIVIAVVLSFEIFWLYEWAALKMNKKFGYATFLSE
jgi:CHASE2 domain-containing sensor protein